MLRRRHAMARAVAASAVVLAAFGVAAAAADGLPSSSPELFRDTTNSVRLSDQGFDGQGVTVAVIDTGMADVAGFDGKVIHQENISSAPNEGDQYGHGTFVGGIIHSAAPQANLISLKLSDANGAVDVSQVFAALYWVITHKEQYGIDVVNLSFGNDSKQSAFTSPLNWAVQQLWDAGIVVVASAGNLGDEANTVTKPADDPLIISVGSTDENGTPTRDDDTVAAYSSRGPTQDSLTKPDVVAPGARLVSLRAPGSTVDTEHPEARVGEHHFRGSGTSFSAPLTVGVIAQMLSAEPSLTPDQVKAGLLSSATLIAGDPSTQGAGTLRAVKALNAARLAAPDNQSGVVRSTGDGSVEGARGSATVEVEARVKRLDGTIDTVSVPVEGNKTAKVAPDELLPNLAIGEDPLEALDPIVKDDLIDETNWDASRWGASSWGASRWGASQWGASRWGASTWGASTWGASRWGASTWGSSQWWASRWG